MSPLITPDLATRLIASHLAPLGTEKVEIAHCGGRILSGNIVADRDFPPFDRAMMDGIAFRFAPEIGKGSLLKVAGLHAAGSPPPPPLADGACYEIMTGAVFPRDCDTLVPYEDVTLSRSADGMPLGCSQSATSAALPTRKGEPNLEQLPEENTCVPQPEPKEHEHPTPGTTQAKTTATLNSPPTPGDFIHPAGSNARAGDTILPSGIPLSPTAIGLAASAGCTHLSVIRRPRLAIISTGDELVDISTTPELWQIRRSSPVALTALFHNLSADPPTIICVPDDESETRSLISQAVARHDVIVITGGISKGKRDFIRPVLDSLVGQPLFHGIAQRPGKPLAVWKTGNSPFIFALPGNPTSTLACATRYVVPALKSLTGQSVKTQQINLTSPAPEHPHLTQFLPTQLDPAANQGTLTSPKNSGDELSPVHATGFAEIPPGKTSPPYSYHPF